MVTQTHVAQIQIDAQGRILTAADVAISGGGGGSTGEATLVAPALAAYTFGSTKAPPAQWTTGTEFRCLPRAQGSTQVRALYKAIAAGDFDVKIGIRAQRTD